jgi:hypothetical protein
MEFIDIYSSYFEVIFTMMQPYGSEFFNKQTCPDEICDVFGPGTDVVMNEDEKFANNWKMGWHDCDFMKKKILNLRPVSVNGE